MAGGFDYWRIPVLEASPPATDDDEPSGAGGTNTAGPGNPLDTEGNDNAETPTVPAVSPATPRPMQLPQMNFSPCESKSSLKAPLTLEYLDQVFGLDDVHIKESSYPVQLMSLSSFLRQFCPASKVQAVHEMAALQHKIPTPSSGPPHAESVENAGTHCSWDLRSIQLLIDQAETSQCIAAAPTSCDAASFTEAPRSGQWRTLYAGSIMAPDPLLCSSVRPVPSLPNPLVILQDAPAIVEDMLAAIPQESRDAKAFQPPLPVDGLRPMCRGPGGLLPGHTPRQLAQNMLAAAILNRLAANVLTEVARCSAHLRASGPEVLPEESALAAAQRKLLEATRELELAQREEVAAQDEMRAARAGDGANLERQRQLEGIVGWKSSLKEQLLAELGETRRALGAAEESLRAARQSERQAPWHRAWPGPVPEQAATEPIFRVRLTAKSPELMTVRDFVEAMQLGLIDRSGCGFVTKHVLEAAFVSHLADGLLLCAPCAEGPAPDAPAEAYVHIPVPSCVSTGVLEPGASCELQAPRPHHALLLRMDGQTFSFATIFGAFGSRAVGFAGLGAHALTYSTPWNRLHYGDLLWAKEAQQTLDILPVVATLHSLVVDADVHIGVFPSVDLAAGEVPLGTGVLALLQAVLFNDVKMWPVAMPAAVRVRWEYLIRALRHMLERHRETGAEGGGPATDLVLDEALPPLLAALSKVPDDLHMGCPPGCHGFSDRLKRIQLSALPAGPLRSASRLRRVVREASKLWSDFEQDCGLP